MIDEKRDIHLRKLGHFFSPLSSRPIRDHDERLDDTKSKMGGGGGWRGRSWAVAKNPREQHK